MWHPLRCMLEHYFRLEAKRKTLEEPEAAV